MSINVHRCLALLSGVLLVFISVVRAMDDMAQDVLKGPETTTFQSPEPWEWRVELSRDWDVLGPFPIHAREQHFLSPSFPIDLSSPYHHEPQRTWPSSYADDALVTWTKARADPNGNLAVSFPLIRWETLLKAEGWASFQHHTVLRTTLTIHPPETGYGSLPPKLHIDLKQGSYFSLVPRFYNEDERASESERFVPEWHAGNIYDLSRAHPSTVNLPGNLSIDNPNVYDLFVSGDYEIRLFGEPKDEAKLVPTLQVSLSVKTAPSKAISLVFPHDIVPDFINGYAFGNAVGIGLRAFDGRWKVNELKTSHKDFPKCISLSLLHESVIEPSQTRSVPILLKQSCAVKESYETSSLSFHLSIISLDPESEGEELLLPVNLVLRHYPMWSSYQDIQPIKGSFFFATSHPTVFLAKPPYYPPERTSSPVLALHGAGVDVTSSPFWADANLRKARSWIVMPPGRTEWGLDWHGPSASEAWASVRALSKILETSYPSWGFNADAKVTLVGHSNGGQGVWYLASRFPDKVRAAIPAAGYIKSQAYVPLTQSKAGHYIDPSLRAILESSLTPDDNDLFLSNVAKIPILAIHGGNDDNVPTWHSREYYSVVKAWGDGLNISFHEDKGKEHWYPGVFDSIPVQQFLRQHLDAEWQHDVTSFTLTVSNPAHSGSLHGWTINELGIPGRLARLHIRIDEGRTHVRATNVRWASFAPHALGSQNTIIINDEYQFEPMESTGKQFLFLSEDGLWTRSSPGLKENVPPPRGRIQNILDTQAPFHLIIPDPAKYPRAFSVALRIAHVLEVYHKLDAEVITDEVATALFPAHASQSDKNTDSTGPTGNLIVVGGSENAFGKSLLAQNQTEFRFTSEGEGEGVWGIRRRVIREKGVGLLFTHPHPTNARGLTLFLAGTDEEGLERAWRLFPYRTGIPVPDWIVIGRDADWQSAGGVLGAGVWDNEWKWNEAMSWLS